MSKKRVDIAIVGAGLIGSTLALWLAKHTALTIAVIERNAAMAQPQEPNQRVIALGQLAVNLLDDVGVFQRLNSEQSHPYTVMRVWDENSNGELAFDSDSLEAAQLGYMVDSPTACYQLQQKLLLQASQSKSRIECYFGVKLNALNRQNERGFLTATDGDGTLIEISTQLIVAADGAHSWVRQQAGIFANHHSYQQRGIVARIKTEKPHQDCAWQRFLSTGPLAILPLANNQSSIVWSADEAFATELMALEGAEFEIRLEHALQSRLGNVRLLSSRAAFPLHSQRAETYFKRNIVLLGDAAHSIHPLAGQGANLGFKDARALGQLLSSLSANEVTAKQLGEPKFLAQYQRKRQADNQQTDALMSALHASYQFDLPIWMAARGMGMNMLNRSAVLRGLFAKQAMGL